MSQEPNGNCSEKCVVQMKPLLFGRDHPSLNFAERSNPVTKLSAVPHLLQRERFFEGRKVLKVTRKGMEAGWPAKGEQ